MLKKLLFTFLIFTIGFFDVRALTSSQSGLYGSVVDHATGDALPFASIGVRGSSKGTIANSEGKFTLDISGLDAEDEVVISHMGYETVNLIVGDLTSPIEVRLKQAVINLQEVSIYARQLTAEEIIEKIRENYEENHPEPKARQRVFWHTYEDVKMPGDDRLVLKKSDFEGMDRQTFDKILKMLPEQFSEYQDALVELYAHEGKEKLIPIEAISLEEGSMKDMEKQMEALVSDFIEEVESSQQVEDVYFKFRTGIFSFKADDESENTDSTEEDVAGEVGDEKPDSLHYAVSTNTVKGEITTTINQYARLNEDYWHFITDPGRYRFTLDDITIINDELVYAISFEPRWRGLYTGKIYASTSTFGILQLEYRYAKGKDNENIQLLGVGHSMKNKEGRMIFENRGDGYYLKYLYAHADEDASIERGFSFMKKEKRFLWDKTLNKMKLDINMHVNVKSTWELLVMDWEALDEDRFKKAEQPEEIKFKREYAYSPEMWADRTVIVPTKELQQFKRQNDIQ